LQHLGLLNLYSRRESRMMCVLLQTNALGIA
jgi:hypothetical protein